MTAPYAATVLDYYGAAPMTYVTAARVVTAAGVLVATLDVRGGELTFDEEWAPYVQARLTVVDPGQTFDLRSRHRVQIDLGYVYPTGVRDVAQAATLVLTTADLDRRTGLVELTAQSDESLVQRSAQWTAADIVTTYPDVGAGIRDVVTKALTPYVPAYVTTLPATSPAFLTNYTLRTLDPFWPHVETLRDAAGAVVYCDETRVWRIAAHARATGTALSPSIATGDTVSTTASQVVTESSKHDDLSRWANLVIVVHEWTDAAGVARRDAASSASTGGYAPATVGYSVYTDRRTTPSSGIQAQGEADSLRVRMEQRALTSTVTALACYWWRPRNQIAVDPGLLTERLTRVTFDLDGSGLMHLSTRDDTLWL